MKINWFTVRDSYDILDEKNKGFWIYMRILRVYKTIILDLLSLILSKDNREKKCFKDFIH
jgi:hypothetical protein